MTSLIKSFSIQYDVYVSNEDYGCSNAGPNDVMYICNILNILKINDIKIYTDLRDTL